MIERPSDWNLIKQLLGGMLWGVFFIIAPVIEIVILGAILWMPLFIWRERRRSARYGLYPGGVFRIGVIVLAIAIATVAPTKHEDRRVGPFPQTTLTLAQLVSTEVIYPLSDPQYELSQVTLPSLLPTRREVMRAISEQTGLRASILHCGNGATILFGSGGGRIRVNEIPEQRPPGQSVKPAV